MIGLIVFSYIMFVIVIAMLGLGSYLVHTTSGGRTTVGLTGLFILAASFAAFVFLVTAALFTEQSTYHFSFAAWMAILNVATPYFLSLRARTLPTHGVLLLGALRISPLFFIVYWFTFAEKIMMIFGIKGYY